jgi:hypothetical protein
VPADAAFNFAAQICQDGTVSGTVEAGKKSITKSVKSRTMCARNNEVVDVCHKQNLVDIGCSHPHAFFIANFSVPLCFEEGAHCFVPDPSCGGHAIQGFAKQVANFEVLRVAWGGRYVHLVIVAITRQQVTLNECLVNFDVIRKYVMLSGESQHKAQTAGVRHRTKAVLKVTRPRCILLFHVLSLYDKSKVTHQAFFWVLIDLIMELLGLIMKPFDNQTKIWV